METSSSLVGTKKPPPQGEGFSFVAGRDTPSQADLQMSYQSSIIVLSGCKGATKKEKNKP
jgi:hypothetical protein